MIIPLYHFPLGCPPEPEDNSLFLKPSDISVAIYKENLLKLIGCFLLAVYFSKHHKAFSRLLGKEATNGLTAL